MAHGSPPPSARSRSRPVSATRRRGPGRALARALVWLVGAALVIYGAVWSYRLAASQLGPFTPLAAVLAGGLVLAVAGPWLLVHYHGQFRAGVARALAWVGARLAATGLPQRFARRYPRLARFIVARFTPGSPTGLALTAWVIVGLGLVEQVVELLVEVVFGSRVVALDHRITNLVATIRTTGLDEFMYAVTGLGSLQIVAVLAIAAALIALLAGRRRDAALLILVTGASWLSAQGLKLLVARPRPPLVDARLDLIGFSFPSAHAALAAAFYGAAAYLLIRGLRRESLKIAVGILAALLVLVIGVSRGYLGVHYSSDILAGWEFGALWFVLMVIAEHLLAGRQGRQARAAPRAATPFAPARRALTIASTTALLLVSTGYAAIAVENAAVQLPPQPQPQPVTPVAVPADAVPDTVQQQLPHYTEGLTGDRQEPVSLVFVGTQARLEAAFRDAGWTQAQKVSLGSVGGGLRAALTHRGDPAGPVTPSFLAEQPNALGFSLPVGETFAQRHHIRIWSTIVQTSAGEPVWLATASFDRGLELAPTTFLPTHQIAPDIDTERAFIVSSLQGAGAVARQQTIQLVPRESGYNFDGDPFHTDGQTVILYLS